jgi:hypothetical protein
MLGLNFVVRYAQWMQLERMKSQLPQSHRHYVTFKSLYKLK